MEKKDSIWRFDVLDVFRGIAAVLVSLFHYTIHTGNLRDILLIANAHRLVDFFFVLSGFIIVSKYHNRISSGHEFKLFCKKRFLRLYPLHLFILIMFLLFELVKFVLYSKGIFKSPPFSTNSIKGLLQNILMLQGFFKNTNYLTWNYPSWSISVEFFNYLLFAFLFFLLSKVRLYFKLLCMVFIVVISLILLNSNENLFIFKPIITCTQSFFLGGIVFFIYQKIRTFSISSKKYTIFEIISITILYTSISYLPDNKGLFLPFVYSYTILIFSHQSGFVSFLLNKSFGRFLGKLSYSIYMTHALIANVFFILFINILKVDSMLFDLSSCLFIIIVVLTSYFTNKYVENIGSKLNF